MLYKDVCDAIKATNDAFAAHGIATIHEEATRILRRDMASYIMTTEGVGNAYQAPELLEQLYRHQMRRHLSDAIDAYNRAMSNILRARVEDEGSDWDHTRACTFATHQAKPLFAPMLDLFDLIE